nr:hypothetical protein [Candidatus Brachybacter algidus]
MVLNKTNIPAKAVTIPDIRLTAKAILEVRGQSISHHSKHSADNQNNGAPGGALPEAYMLPR